jgi:methyl-accepting chemotaxis protein
MTQVDQSAHQQNLGIREIAKALLLVEETTHRTAAMAEESAAASASLNAQAAGMQEIVSALQSLV